MALERATDEKSQVEEGSMVSGIWRTGCDFNGIMKALDDSSDDTCQIGLIHSLHPKLAAFMSAIRSPVPFDVIAKYLMYHIQGRKDGSLVSSRRTSS